MRDEFPGVSFINARLDIDFGFTQISRDGIPRAENCSCRIFSNRDRHFVEEWLVTKSPSIDLVCDFGNLLPCLPTINASENWKINQWRLGGVIFPCCYKYSILQFNGAGVQNPRLPSRISNVISRMVKVAESFKASSPETGIPELTQLLEQLPGYQTLEKARKYVKDSGLHPCSWKEE